MKRDGDWRERERKKEYERVTRGERKRGGEQILLYSVAMCKVKRDGELQRGSETETAVVASESSEYSAAMGGDGESRGRDAQGRPLGAILPSSSVRSVQYAPSG